MLLCYICNTYRGVYIWDFAQSKLKMPQVKDKCAVTQVKGMMSSAWGYQLNLIIDIIGITDNAAKHLQTLNILENKTGEDCIADELQPSASK